MYMDNSLVCGKPEKAEIRSGQQASPVSGPMTPAVTYLISASMLEVT